MSASRRMGRDRDAAVKRAALAAVKAQGCQCSPVITVGPGPVAGQPRVEAAHDDWCPLLRVMQERGPDRLPQVVAYDPEAFS